MSKPTVSDIQVYQKLSAVADELDQLASEGASLVGDAALNTAARTVRGMANAVYRQIMSDSSPLDS
jgi:ubiquinone biosynthesis protein UbiJ